MTKLFDKVVGDENEQLQTEMRANQMSVVTIMNEKIAEI